MMNSLLAGVSGLRAFETKMDVVGNNIANVNTAGFKSGKVTFSELLNQNLKRDLVRFDTAPRVSNQVGLGVRVSSIDRNFEQGALESTNVSTDLAIDGAGWFLVRDGGTQYVSRSGGFKFNQDGFLVNATGLQVQGFNADVNGRIVQGGATDDVRINFDDIFRPQQTGQIVVAGNLDAGTSRAEVLSQTTAFTTNDGEVAGADADLSTLDQILIPAGLQNGDEIDITLTDNNGAEVNATFTYGTNGTTLGNFVDFLNTQFGSDTSVSLEDGLVVARNRNQGPVANSENLALSISGVITRPGINATTQGTNGSNERTITQNSPFSVNGGQGVNLSTRFIDLDQNFEAGDTIEFVGTNDGTGAPVTSTFVVAAGSTLNNLLTQLSTDFGGTAQLNANGLIQITGQNDGTSQLTVTAVNITEDGADATPDLDLTVPNLIALDAPNYQVTQVGEIGSQTISSTVYDALGEAHTFILTLTQSDYNTWSYSSRFLNGEVIFAGGEGNVSFDTDGNITNITDGDGNRVDEITVSFDPGNGSGNIRFDLDINGSTDFGAVTQFDGTTSIGVISQDGFAKGELLDVFIDSAGNIVGSYSNGKTKNLAQIALATVANQQALNHVGDGLFSANVQSGQLLIQTASNIDGTTVNSGFLEGSNVDLAEQFTDMIITQRAYQSNARVITTADQLLAEAVQLKR